MNSCTVFKSFSFFFLHLGFPKVVLCDSVRFDGEVKKLIINMTFKVFGLHVDEKSLLHERRENSFRGKLVIYGKSLLIEKDLRVFLRQR
jgi:hypothetical protein